MRYEKEENKIFRKLIVIWFKLICWLVGRGFVKSFVFNFIFFWLVWGVYWGKFLVDLLLIFDFFFKVDCEDIEDGSIIEGLEVVVVFSCLRGSMVDFYYFEFILRGFIDDYKFMYL